MPGYQEPGPEKFEEVQHRDVPAPTPKPAAADSAAPAGENAAQAAASTGDGYPQADLSQCVFCTLCAKKCPQSALTVDRTEKKWELAKEDCIQCGLCAQNCPKKCISM